MPRNRTTAPEPEVDTRTRILDAAEKMIAERGIEGASLRAITTAAGANTAAVHYYFRQKTDLVEAVFDRRAGIVAEERLKRLGAVLSHSKKPSLEALILAYITPGLTTCFDSAELRKHFGRVRARFSHERDPTMQNILRRHFREPAIQFVDALRQMFPHLSRRELMWRYHIMIGAMIYLMAHPGRVQAAEVDDVEPYNPDDMEEAIQYFVPMLAAIFRAPPASPEAVKAAMTELGGTGSVRRG